MTPEEVQAIHSLLINRVQCQSAREGVAIAQLANKLVQHFGVVPPAPGAAPATKSKEPANKQKK